MKATTVHSNEAPESIQLLKGKQLINVDIESVTSTDDEGNESTSYNYTQLESEIYENADSAIVEYRKNWVLSEFDWYDTQIKYHARNDTKRAVATVDELNAYAIALSDYIVDGVICTDKPTRPE